METDRGAVLSIRAAAEGVIDFSAANVADVSWWRRTNVLIGAMTRRDELTVLQAALAHHCALAANASLTDESFKASQETLKFIANAIANAVRPWAARSTDEAFTDKVKSLTDLYRQLVGDPDDPAFMAKLVEEYRTNEERRARATVEAVRETEEQRLDRLINTRNAGRR